MSSSHENGTGAHAGDPGSESWPDPSAPAGEAAAEPTSEISAEPAGEPASEPASEAVAEGAATTPSDTVAEVPPLEASPSEPPTAEGLPAASEPLRPAHLPGPAPHGDAQLTEKLPVVPPLEPGDVPSAHTPVDDAAAGSIAGAAGAAALGAGAAGAAGVTRASARSAARGAPAGPGAGAAAAHTPEPAAATRTPGTLTGNPFEGVPWRDYAMDLVAFLLLGLSLALSWSFYDAATERVDVVVATLVSILSLALFYLARVGVFPASWSGRGVAIARAAMNLPYLVVVVLTLAEDAAFGDIALWRTTSGGLGAAVGFGLAGAVVAALPRHSEVADPRGGDRLRSWSRWALIGLLVLVGLVQVAGVAAEIDHGGDIWHMPGGGLSAAASVLSALVLLAIAAGPLVGAVLGSTPWRHVLVAVGATAAVYLLTVEGSEGFTTAVGGHAGSSIAFGSGAVVLLPAAAAVVLLAPSRAARTTLRGWLATASTAWLSIVAVAGASAVVMVLVTWSDVANRSAFSSDTVGFQGWLLATVLLLVVALMAALAARALNAGNPYAGWRPAVFVTLGVMAVGIAVLALSASHGHFLDLEALLIAFGLPALVFFALLVPAEVRALHAGGVVLEPEVEPEPEAAADLPAHGYTAAQASDPRTDLAVLADIVRVAPELRPYVAANPSTYPDLLGWLAQLGDPEVDAALASRPL